MPGPLHPRRMSILGRHGLRSPPRAGFAPASPSRSRYPRVNGQPLVPVDLPRRPPHLQLLDPARSPGRSGAGDLRTIDSFRLPPAGRPAGVRRLDVTAHRRRRDWTRPLQPKGQEVAPARSGCGRRPSGSFWDRRPRRPGRRYRDRPRRGRGPGEAARTERRPEPRRPSGVLPPARELGPASSRETRPAVVTCPLAVIRSSQPSLFASRNATPKPSKYGWDGQSDRCCLVCEQPLTQVVEKRGRLAVKVGDRQVGKPVAVQVAASDAHASLEPRPSCRPRRRKRPSPRTGSLQGCGTGNWLTCHWRRKDRCGHRHRGQRRRPPAHARRGRRCPAAASRPRTVRCHCGRRGPAARRSRGRSSGSPGFGRRSRRRVLVVERQVVADVEVEVAVAVEIGERRRSGPVAIASEPGPVGDVFESPVPRLRNSEYDRQRVTNRSGCPSLS